MTRIKKLKNIKDLWIWQCFLSYWKRLFCLFAVPLMIIAVVLTVYNVSKKDMDEQNYITQEFFSSYYKYNDIIEKINKSYSNIILQDEMLRYVMNAGQSNTNLNNDITAIIRLFNTSIISMEYVDSIHFYCFDNDYVLSTKNGNRIESFYNRGFYDKYKETGNPNNITYFKGDDYLKIPETMNICYAYYPKDSLKGMLVFSINLSELSGEISERGTRKDRGVIITDFEDFFFSNSDICKSAEECRIMADKLPVSDGKKANFKKYKGNYIFKMKNESAFPNMYFVCKSNAEITYGTVLLLLLILLLINVVVLGASLMLTNHMRRQLIGVVSEFIEQFSLDENTDSAEISSNIFDNIKKGEQLEIAFPKQVINLRKTQLYALQVQLSPHFLYNTLNSINLMVMNLTKSDNTISRLIMLLSELLYDVLDTKKYVVPLKKEIEYSKKFLEIENIKRKNSVSINWDVDNELLECGVIKFILQPVLENIFRHAFRAGQEDKEINILVKNHEKGFCISVKDNGRGISEERLAEINSALGNDAFEGRHIGLVNVNKRIQMLYGSEYGVSVSSLEGNGTVVSIYLPRRKK